MSRKANDLLSELRALGLTEGVATTVKSGSTTVEAGTLSSSYKGTDDEALEKALSEMLSKIKAKSQKDRPAAWESTTRTVAEPEDRNNPNAERSVHPVGKDDV